MRTITGKILSILLLGWLAGLCGLTPGWAFPVLPPADSLGGLIPGLSTVGDASRLYGVYDVRLPGDYLAYVGGPRATNAYRWTNGVNGKVPGLIVETQIGSGIIDAIIVSQYPGIATSCGLMPLVPASVVTDRYGLPDYAYEIEIGGVYGPPISYRELYYLNRGLLVIVNQPNGRPNWTVSTLILTYPTYLRNAVSDRYRYALSGRIVEDITSSYRTWASMERIY